MKKPVVKSRSQKIFDILLNHDEFKREYLVSRKRFLQTAKETVRDDGSKYLSQWNDKILQEETTRIMALFASLPTSWEASIRDYIKTGVLISPVSSTMPKVGLEIIDPTRQSKLTVQVFKHTTKKEYVEAWKTIEQLQAYMWELDPKPLSKKEITIIRKRAKRKTEMQIYNETGVGLANIRKIISRKAPQLGVTVKHRKP